MDIVLNHLSIIDWDLATKLAGNKKEIAEEILRMLAKNLPKDIKESKQLDVVQKFPELLQRVHKLHRSICYCGIPRLKIVISYIETVLKNYVMFNLPSLFDQMDIEVKLLLEQCSYHNR